MSAGSGWPPMAGQPGCEVYVARLPSLQPRHHALLDEHEARRRARFRTHADRRRFVLAAVTLRAVAGQRTGTDAAAVAVDRSCDRCGARHGRPRLPEQGLEASVSHSGDVVAVAVTSAGPVGVDLELLTSRDYGLLAASACAPAEQLHVRGPAGFYAYWTRKEAVLKATGEGLRTPMTDLLMAPPGAAPALLAVRGAPPPPCRMADLAIGAGYAGAVAVLTAGPVAFSTIDAGPLLARL